MRAYQDLTGQQFGRITVTHRNFERGPGTYWYGLCSCGTQVLATAGDFKSGHSKSCGCLQRTHGMSHSRTYRSWEAMIQRATNPKPNYKYWNGRGITVCERWKKFENFLADMGERPAGKSIDRVNNDGNYEPGNCRWATQREQRLNSRRKLVKVSERAA